MTKVLFSGCVLANGGDRAIAEAQLQVLSAPERELEVTATDPTGPVLGRLLPDACVQRGFAARLHSGSTGRGQRVRRPIREFVVLAVARSRSTSLLRLLGGSRYGTLVREMGTFDSVVYTGGTSLIEDYDLRPKLFELRLAAACGLPITLMTQSLGPFRKRANITRIRNLARRAALILLRDERSAENLRAIGASPANSRVLPDIVFALATENALEDLRSRVLPSAPAVAISVRELANYARYSQRGTRDTYLDAIARLIDHITSTGGRVTLISTCQGVPEYWTDDSAVAAELLDRIGEAARRHVTLDRGFHSTRDLLARLREHDVVVATRLHMAILSLDAGTVVLPIAYEFKTHTVFESLGLGDRVLDVDSVDGETLVAAFDRFCADVDTLRPALAAATGEAARKAAEAGELTAQALAWRS